MFIDAICLKAKDKVYSAKKDALHIALTVGFGLDGLPSPTVITQLTATSVHSESPQIQVV